ncbi:MAG: N-acetyltransferase [Arthrospira sp. SH-MAG29]|nr:N-acetyltransferase family protein [Arthrospira sp. SH-MAG29]MBS0018088.1 N-acetyltransferase [Arthrospira sp. SH-MAG29]
MENNLKIRDALENDLPQIIEIYNLAVPQKIATADLEPISVESRLGWYRECQSAQRPLWVVEIDDRIIGWLSFQAFKKRAAYDATAELSIYIHTDYQGQGIGKKLLHQAIEQGQKFGCETLLALIFAHNQPSLKLFDSFGFEQWGYLPQIAVIDGVKRDLVIMGLHLC